MIFAWKTSKFLTRIKNSQMYMLLWSKYGKVLDNRSFEGVVLIDLFETFDPINHDIFTAKLPAFGFDKSSLKLVLVT